MSGFYENGLIFGVVIWRFCLGMALIILVLVVGTRWLLFWRRPGSKPPR